MFRTKRCFFPVEHNNKVGMTHGAKREGGTFSMLVGMFRSTQKGTINDALQYGPSKQGAFFFMQRDTPEFFRYNLRGL